LHGWLAVAAWWRAKGMGLSRSRQARWSTACSCTAAAEWVLRAGAGLAQLASSSAASTQKTVYCGGRDEGGPHPSTLRQCQLVEYAAEHGLLIERLLGVRGLLGSLLLLLRGIHGVYGDGVQAVVIWLKGLKVLR